MLILASWLNCPPVRCMEAKDVTLHTLLISVIYYMEAIMIIYMLLSYPQQKTPYISERRLCSSGSWTEVGCENKSLPVQATQFFPPGGFSDWTFSRYKVFVDETNYIF